MSITIDRKRCDGCGLSKEPSCMKSCPGDLIYKDFSIKKAVLRRFSGKVAEMNARAIDRAYAMVGGE